MITTDENLVLGTSMPIPWDTLEAIIEGKSAVDLNGMPIRTEEEARDLIFHYGYDLDDPVDLSLVNKLFDDAVEFINTMFLSPTMPDGTSWLELDEPVTKTASIPKRITQDRDLPKLILTASQGKKPYKFWACAILKVMHTLSFLQNNATNQYMKLGSEQILSRFSDIVCSDGDGNVQLLAKDGSWLTIYRFEKKAEKPLESMLIKLLCKPKNVADDIWDRVGVRFITHKTSDVLLVIEILRQHKLLLFPNVVPARSRNTLLDFNDFRYNYEVLNSKSLGQTSSKKRGVTPKTISDLKPLFDQIAVKPPESSDFLENKASLADYRAIHITCRQMIKIPNDDVLNPSRIIFPYEIQLTDKQNHQENKAGKTAHKKYKTKQLVAARRRVLGALLAPIGKAID